jgi:hypothetical protein
MHNLKLLPYRMGSESAKDLAKYLNILRVHPDGAYVPRLGHVILNWGCSQPLTWAERAAARNVTMLNKPQAVGIASNKQSTLIALQRAGIRIPEFTTNRNVADGWLRDGHTVVERHNLNGNSGDGIRIVSLGASEPYVESQLTWAPLYTKFIPKTAEFRVHVFRGQVIDYIEKKRVAAEHRPENFNRHISSVNLGWVFARTNIMDSPDVKEIAIRAVQALGLDFGAVDVAYWANQPYVLEVNTAPGLHGTTLVNYVNAVRRYMGCGNLSESAVNEIMAQVTGEDRTNGAANSALDVAPRNSDEVLLRLDRNTALKLKNLLASLV